MRGSARTWVGVAAILTSGCAQLLDLEAFVDGSDAGTTTSGSGGAGGSGGLAGPGGSGGTGGSRERCPDDDAGTFGRQGASGHCYLLRSAMEPWDTARGACMNLPSGSWTWDLAAFSSEGEQIEVAAWLKTLPPLVGADAPDVWFGANDKANENTFVWSNGEAPFKDYENWFPGEPNDDGVGEDCGVIYPEYEFQWADFDCVAMMLPSLCEGTPR